MRWLFVIARNSSFTYKGRAVDVKQVGRELGVRYVLEGSVRKAGNRVRITGQLIDASTGAHLWAERFDGELEDIFDLQDQVTASVVGAIAPKLEQAEIERAQAQADRKPRRLRLFSARHGGFPPVDKGGQQRGAAAVLQGHRTRPQFRCGLWHGGAMLRPAQDEWLGDRSRTGDRRNRNGWRGGRQNWAGTTRSRSVRPALPSPLSSATSTTATPSSIGLLCSIRTWPWHGSSAAGSRSGSVSRRWRSSAQRVPCA